MRNLLKPRTGKQTNSTLTSVLSAKKLCFFLLFFGTLVRLVQYLANRSLWADEAVLALNIVNRSYLELLQPLDYEQGAPIGFLWVEKLAVEFFGNHEYALRLFPLLCGIISLFLFYKLAKRWITGQAIPIALALFTSLHYLVYYSSEVKQYAVDLALALLLSLVIIQLAQTSLRLWQFIGFCLVGVGAIWFSHPAVFVVAGLGTVSIIQSLLHKESRQKVIPIAIFCFTCLLSFIAVYLVSLRQLSSNKTLLNSWKGAFPSSLLDINWLFENLVKLFMNPLGFEGFGVVVAIALFLLGCLALFTQQRIILLTLLSPLLFTLMAAYLHQYPFRSRLLVFLAPFIILAIAEGALYLWKTARSRSKVAAAISLILMGCLLVPPFANASYRLAQPYVREEIKPAINYVKTHQQSGDILYVFQRGEYQFKYYAEKYGYQPGDYIIGIDDLDDGKKISPEERNRYLKDLEQLKGRQRVWIIFSHINVPEEKALVLAHLNEWGNQIDGVESPGASVHLYDLSRTSNVGVSAGAK